MITEPDYELFKNNKDKNLKYLINKNEELTLKVILFREDYSNEYKEIIIEFSIEDESRFYVLEMSRDSYGVNGDNYPSLPILNNIINKNLKEFKSDIISSQNRINKLLLNGI